MSSQSQRSASRSDSKKEHDSISNYLGNKADSAASRNDSEKKHDSTSNHLGNKADPIGKTGSKKSQGRY
ncbi:hypothetical protein JHK87_024042 [Glycine soja]|nr:hypothetical protein JHK87_024042 [Glycine soja]